MTAWVTSGYGYRLDPFHGELRFHHGVDIAAPLWTVIRSGTPGVVAACGTSKTAGRWVAVARRGASGQPVFYVYAHLAAWYVQKGDAVERGTPIGAVGQTGRATGPHLHFEVSTAGGSRSPLASELPIVR